ncbi:hypothetical protein ACFU99_39355, partial [Streptomyces sp. NPDC057654]
VTEVVARLRGAGGDSDGDGGTGRTGAVAGTPVRLGVLRGGHGWDLTLRRARLATENVTVDRLHDGPTGPPRSQGVAGPGGPGEQLPRARGE